MRQRKAKDLKKRMDECGAFLVKEPGPSAWERAFGRRTDAGELPEGAADAAAEYGAADAPAELYVEIGCGKGDFLIAKAMDDADGNYLGIEGQETVLLRALEKAMWLSGTAAPLGNLQFACTYVRTMDRLFEESTLAGIYLNFSDPWPKSRHKKRRLTWRGRLKDYQWALRQGGFIEFKTDNDPLFDFTLEEIASCGWKPVQLSRDLHHSDYEARLVMTEYEKKFHSAGKNINFVRVEF